MQRLPALRHKPGRVCVYGSTTENEVVSSEMSVNRNQRGCLHPLRGNDSPGHIINVLLPTKEPFRRATLWHSRSGVALPLLIVPCCSYFFVCRLVNLVITTFAAGASSAPTAIGSQQDGQCHAKTRGFRGCLQKCSQRTFLKLLKRKTTAADGPLTVENCCDRYALSLTLWPPRTSCTTIAHGDQAVGTRTQGNISTNKT